VDFVLPQVAIMRCQANVLTDPQVILESLRSLIQPEINNRQVSYLPYLPYFFLISLYCPTNTPLPPTPRINMGGG
jgi:hypothetical protein